MQKVLGKIKLTKPSAFEKAVIEEIEDNLRNQLYHPGLEKTLRLVGKSLTVNIEPGPLPVLRTGV